MDEAGNPLTRLFTSAAFIVTLIFTAAIVLMRFAPYQDGGLLSPPVDCAAPCW
ncbi:MAG: hypothetical protein ABI690_03830 [Chloroflexota bacterium]